MKKTALMALVPLSVCGMVWYCDVGLLLVNMMGTLHKNDLSNQLFRILTILYEFFTRGKFLRNNYTSTVGSLKRKTLINFGDSIFGHMISFHSIENSIKCLFLKTYFPDNAPGS